MKTQWKKAEVVETNENKMTTGMNQQELAGTR